MADPAAKFAPEPGPEPASAAGSSLRPWVSVRAEMAALFRAIDSPWTLALLFAAGLNTSLLYNIFYGRTYERIDPDVVLFSHAAPFLAILAFWFAGRRWGVKSFAPAILVGLCFLPIYETNYGVSTLGDVLMLPALLIAAHFGAAPQFPTELYAYRRVGPIDALVLFCLLATGAVIFQALAFDQGQGKAFGPIFVAGGAIAPMVVVMLALAVSGADRRLAFVAILLAAAFSLPGLTMPTTPSMSPFVSRVIGLSPGDALVCLTALYIEKAAPLLLRWRWEAGVKSFLGLGAAIYLSQWVIVVDTTAVANRLDNNEFSGWVLDQGLAETAIGQPALPWVIAFAIGVAVCFRRTHIAQPLHQTRFSIRNGDIGENAGHFSALAAVTALFFFGVNRADFGDWGLLNPFLTFEIQKVFLWENRRIVNGGVGWLAYLPTLAMLLLGYLAARPFAGDGMPGPQLAVWRAVRRGADVPVRPDRPRRILLAKVMGAGWVWFGPVIFGLALSMMIGGELARRDIAFDPRSAIRDHVRGELFTGREYAILVNFLKPDIDAGLVSFFRSSGDVTIRLNSPGVGPLKIPESTQSALRRLATKLKQIPGPVAVRVHTSSEPPASFWHRTNDALSEATARRVAGYLAAHLGDPTRVSAEGRGDSEPIADNNTAEGADRNDRIEIVLLGPPTSDDGPQSLDELVRSFETCGALSVSQRATRGGRSIIGALASDQELAQLKEAVETFGERADFNSLQVLPPETCAARAQLTAAWRRTMAPLCRATVEGRYPFDRSAEAEAALGDVTRLFAPRGAMDIFFTSNLADMVDQGARPWQWRKDVDLGYSDQIPEQFQRAADLRDAFFAGVRLSWAFEIEVEAMDAELTRSVLDIGGLQINYAHGPIQTVPMEWPLNAGASLRFSPEIAGAANALVRTGDWAWFRLLDAADLQEAKAPGAARAVFEIGDRTMTYRLRSASPVDPISAFQSLNFRCPLEL